MKATTIVHWPGRDVAACDRHADRLSCLAHALNFKLEAERCAPIADCIACENEGREMPAFQQMCTDGFTYDLS